MLACDKWKITNFFAGVWRRFHVQILFVWMQGWKGVFPHSVICSHFPLSLWFSSESLDAIKQSTCWLQTAASPQWIKHAVFLKNLSFTREEKTHTMNLKSNCVCVLMIKAKFQLVTNTKWRKTWTHLNCSDKKEKSFFNMSWNNRQRMRTWESVCPSASWSWLTSAGWWEEKILLSCRGWTLTSVQLYCFLWYLLPPPGSVKASIS